MKTQKWKKASRGSKLDYGQESEMFLKLILTANKKDKTKKFDKVSLFAPHYL